MHGRARRCTFDMVRALLTVCSVPRVHCPSSSAVRRCTVVNTTQSLGVVVSSIAIPSPAIAVAALGNRLAVSVSLASDADSGFVAVFDRIDLRKPFVVLGGHDCTVTAVAFAGNGLLCSASTDRVLLWDVDAFVYNPSDGACSAGCC